MGTTDFDYVMGLVLKSEGGYVNNPKDPGGPTNFGITLRDYSEFKGRTVTALEVRNMPLSDALAIYRVKYNKGISFEALRVGSDYTVIDYGVNSGLARPPRVAATLLRRPLVSKMTPDIVKAINDTDPNKLIDAMCDERLHFMKGIQGGALWAEFGKGWNTRVASVRAISHKLANGQQSSIVLPPQAQASDSAKAIHAPDPHIVGKIKAATGASAATGGVSSAPHSLLIAGCVVAGVVIIGGATYYIYQRQVKAANDKVELPPGMVPIAA
jgi:lysozyme family protein